VSGATTLGALAVLVDGARVVLANDTGISHLAAARRTPSVIVFTASDPARWAPANRALHRVVLAARRDAVNETVAHARDLVSSSSGNETTRRPAA